MILRRQIGYGIGRSFIFKVVLLAVFSMLFMMFGTAQRAYANVSLNPDPGATVPSYVRDYFITCDSLGPSPAFLQWVSLEGDASRTSITVAEGTPSIRLQYNFAGVVCQSNSAVTDTRVTVVGSGPAGVSGINGAQLDLSFGAQFQTRGTYRFSSVAFTYTPPTPFVVSQVVDIQLATKVINRFSNNTYLCVPGPGGDRGSLSNSGPCQTNFPFFDIEVIVVRQPPIGTADAADCNLWQGWAFDGDSPTTSIRVHAYIGAPAGAPGSVFVGDFLTDQLRSDVNAAFSISGNHGFRISVPSPYRITDNTVWFYAIGVNTAGAQDGTNTLIGSRFYNGCQPVPDVGCSVAPISIISGNTATPSVTIRHNGPSGAAAISFSGTLRVQGQAADSLSGSLSPGASVVRTGSTRTYVVPDRYTISASFTATYPGGSLPVSCSSFLDVAAPPPAITCTVGNDSIEETTTVAARVSVFHSGPAYAPNVNYVARVVIVSQPTETLTGSLANGGTVVLSTATRTYPAPGVYDVTVFVTASGGGYNNVRAVPYPCSGRITVLTRPYLRTYGNDVQAGLGFVNNSGTCAVDTGNITAFGRNQTSQYAGSGSQLGTFARGAITGFRSASMRAGAQLLPELLSFANTGALVNRAVGRFGGNFAGGVCATNYWARSSTATITGSQNINLTSLASGRYYIRQSNPSIPVAIVGQVPNGVRIALYIEGTAFIRGPSVGYASTNWTTRDQVPSLYVVALGNILIGSNVSNLDGNYIAQNSNDSDGRISTCADPSSMQSYSSNAAFIANCSNKLTINGSFTAAHVNFLRVIGSVRSAVPSEPAASSVAAEVFVYSIDTFIGDQAVEGTHQQTYDSITALPPSL